MSELAYSERAASTSARTSSPTRRTSCTSTSSTAAAPAFEARLVLAATLSPSYGIYSGFENFENVPVARGLRGVPALREVRDQAARARRPAAAADPARSTTSGARTPALQDLSQHHLPRHGQRRADRLREAARPANTIITVVSIDPHQAQEGLAIVPAEPRPAAELHRPRPAHRRALSVAHRSATTSGSSPASVRRTSCASRSDVTVVDDPMSVGPPTLTHLIARETQHGGGPSAAPRTRRHRRRRPAPVVRGRAAVVQARGLLRDPHPRLLRRQRRRLRATSAG